MKPAVLAMLLLLTACSTAGSSGETSPDGSYETAPVDGGSADAIDSGLTPDSPATDSGRADSGAPGSDGSSDSSVDSSTSSDGAVDSSATDSACQPTCLGKQCGDDGCGGSCGTCPGTDTCSASGQCVCTPSCGGKQCGGDGCGGSCGTCPGSDTCNASDQCVCVPSCSGRQCGSDGCGGSCGTCSGSTACNASGQCACAPSCIGKHCGNDGCGGSCGTCTTGDYCYVGTCVPGCTPTCGTSVCGSDGCDGECGACGPDQTCSGGSCTACTNSCPTLTPVTGNSTTCEARLDDCSDCGPATCGSAHYAYGCSGTQGPPLSGCFATASPTEYCCTQAACIRTTIFDGYCTALSLPPNGYSCHEGATPAAGCVLYPSGSGAPGYCCP